MLNEEALSESMALHDVMNDLMVFNAVLQTAGDEFTLRRGGVAIPLIISQPGAGKTASFYDLCMKIGWGLVTVHLAMKPLEELGGIPDFVEIEINGEKYPGTKWSIPDLIGQLYQMAPNVPGVFLCFDDIHLCGSIYLGLMQEFFTERTIRGYKIPDNVAIILMGNSTNKAGAKTQSSAITNRVCMMPVVADFENWRTRFALGGNTEKRALPFDANKLKDLAKQIHRVHPAVTSFLGRDSYQKFFHEEEQVDTPWASPRSWTRFSNWLMAYELMHGRVMDPLYTNYLGTGHVGKEAAAEFVKYYKIFMKFDLVAILNDAKNYTLPDNPVDRYALGYALTNHYCNHKERKSIVPAFAQIIVKYFDEYPDLALMVIRDILDTEKATRKRNLYMDLTFELNSIRPGITQQLLKEVNNA